ncbi:prepilin-type N-terminal cleavage/methylation domain-containing protein [Candidatus Peregrinibacteria bacterium]|nr:prepilin-type N-terminal cleavage/methylation domain-containing protein [Candidatus Peregrinibacteria bacterium]
MFRKVLKKFAGDLKSQQSGFTLTEVMIGIMILTIAIVAATQILIGLIGFNQNNVNSLKAHYLAMEGLEIVRNIRDTNWLHNYDWLGEESGDLWVGDLVPGGGAAKIIGVDANDTSVGGVDAGIASAGLAALKGFAPWIISGAASPVILLGDEDAENSGFTREIQILPYVSSGPDDAVCVGSDCENFVVVKSKVTFAQGIDVRSITLQTILTNWKNGAL